MLHGGYIYFIQNKHRFALVFSYFYYSEHWNFVSDTEFQKNVVGNGLAGDGEGLINDQPVVDIMAASDIYDKIGAVKISFQVS